MPLQLDQCYHLGSTSSRTDMFKTEHIGPGLVHIDNIVYVTRTFDLSNFTIKTSIN